MFLKRFLFCLCVFLAPLKADYFDIHETPITQKFQNTGFMITPSNPVYFNLPTLKKGRIVRIDLNLEFFEDDESPSHFYAKSETGNILNTPLIPWKAGLNTYTLFYCHDNDNHPPSIILENFGNGAEINVKVHSLTLTPCGFKDTYVGNRASHFHLPEDSFFMWNDPYNPAYPCSANQKGIVINNQRFFISSVIAQNPPNARYHILVTTVGDALTLDLEDKNQKALQRYPCEASTEPKEHHFIFDGPLYSLSFQIGKLDGENFLNAFSLYTEAPQGLIPSNREYHSVPFEEFDLLDTLTLTMANKEKYLNLRLHPFGVYQLCFYNEGFGNAEVSVQTSAGQELAKTIIDQRAGFVRLGFQIPLPQCRLHERNRPSGRGKPGPSPLGKFSSTTPLEEEDDDDPRFQKAYSPKPNICVVFKTANNLTYMESREITALKITSTHKGLFKECSSAITCVTDSLLYTKPTSYFKTLFSYDDLIVHLNEVLQSPFLPWDLSKSLSEDLRREITTLIQNIIPIQNHLKNNTFEDKDRKDYAAIYLAVCQLFEESAKKIQIVQQENFDLLIYGLGALFAKLHAKANLDHWALTLHSFLDVLEDPSDFTFLKTWSSAPQ